MTDPGLVSAFSRGEDPISDPNTLGRLVECAVFTHLERKARIEDATLSFWRKNDDLECDFVISLGSSNILLECTAARAMEGKKAQRIERVSKQVKGVKRIVCVSRSSGTTWHPHAGSAVEETALWSFLDRLDRYGLQGLLP